MVARRRFRYAVDKWQIAVKPWHVVLVGGAVMFAYMLAGQ